MIMFHVSLPGCILPASGSERCESYICTSLKQNHHQVSEANVTGGVRNGGGGGGGGGG